MDLAGAIPYVTSGLSLIAFVVAALFYSYRARLRQRTSIILSAPKDQRIAAIEATADFLKIDTSGLSGKSKETIILRQLEIRSRRDQMMFVVALVVAILLGLMAVITISNQGGNQAAASANQTQVPSENTTITASYVVCIGEKAEMCPPNAVHLPCYSSVADWANKECKSFGETKLSSRSGNRCGYYTAQVTCVKSVAQ